MIRFENLCRDQYLIATAFLNNSFRYRLILPADKIMVQICIQIIHFFNVRQRIIHKQVVLIKYMLWQFHMTGAQYFRSIDAGMQCQQLPRAKCLCLLPSEDLSLRKDISVTYRLVSAFLSLMVIYIIADAQINAALFFKRLKAIQDLLQSIRRKPVI